VSTAHVSREPLWAIVEARESQSATMGSSYRGYEPRIRLLWTRIAAAASPRELLCGGGRAEGAIAAVLDDDLVAGRYRAKIDARNDQRQVAVTIGDGAGSGAV
jgi:hypothetical protein